MKKVTGNEIQASKSVVEKVMKDEKLSKSKKMIALFDLGLEVREIAEMMQVRYNFVYNVVSNYCNINGIATETDRKEGKKDQIIEMFLAGKSHKDISITLKTNYNYVFNTIKSYKKEHPELANKEKAAE